MASLLRRAYASAARPAAGAIPPVHWAYTAPEAPLAFDPGAARALLGGARVRTTLLTSTDRMRGSLARTLAQAHAILRPRGLLIGIDWFSDQHVDAGRGEQVDAFTRRNLPPDSHLANTGVVHFFGREHLAGLLQDAGFVVRRLEHKEKQTALPPGPRLAWWDVVAERP